MMPCGGWVSVDRRTLARAGQRVKWAFKSISDGVTYSATFVPAVTAPGRRESQVVRATELCAANQWFSDGQWRSPAPGVVRFQVVSNAWMLSTQVEHSVEVDAPDPWYLAPKAMYKKPADRRREAETAALRRT